MKLDIRKNLSVTLVTFLRPQPPSGRICPVIYQGRWLEECKHFRQLLRFNDYFSPEIPLQIYIQSPLMPVVHIVNSRPCSPLLVLQHPLHGLLLAFATVEGGFWVTKANNWLVCMPEHVALG